jgi:hypothetical protein
LKNFKEKELISFINEALELFENCNYCKAIFTVTFNSPTLTPRIAPEKIYSMHLQELMQRIEMDIQNEENNLAILFFDPVSGEIDRQLRKGYTQIYSSGDFIKTYRHIKDSISFELSHHSFGVQLADYCVGIFQGMLRGYNTSSELFKERIWNILRKSPKGDAFGFGIREIPSNIDNRTLLRGIIQKATGEEEDNPFNKIMPTLLYKGHPEYIY